MITNNYTSNKISTKVSRIEEFHQLFFLKNIPFIAMGKPKVENCEPNNRVISTKTMQIFHKIFELSSQIYQIIIIFKVKSKIICGFYLINLANFLRVFKKINVFNIVLTKL